MALIEIRGLTKLYRMGTSVVRALDGVDLDIEEGEFVAITGASGSGKSTMMHLLGCLDRPTAGSYVLNGRDVSDMSDRELAKIRNEDIGFVFQTFNLINRTTATENVGIPLFYARKGNTRTQSLRALERVGLAPRATHTPAELSGGERQRVAIARSIVNDPVLLLADEPTGNLDSRTGKAIMEVFHSLNEQGVTIVLVTHEPEVAIQTKRIVQMRDGKIISDRHNEEYQAVRARAATATRSEMPGVVSDANAESPDAETAAPLGAAAASEFYALDAPQTAGGGEAALPARRARGATGALAFGIAGPIFLAVMVLAGVWVSRMGVNPQEFSQQNPPPMEYVVVSLAALASLLLSFACAIVAMIWGRAVRRKIHAEPGNWIGGRRAKAAWICGLVTILIPAALICVNVVQFLMRAAKT